ncbi:MAG TPA: CBS domain-containing protein [Alphaproteobacteria bacterium]|nr:CBS domain-containing protein [Alphaproteobacteria bacterium]
MPRVGDLMLEFEEVVHPDHPLEEAVTRMRRVGLRFLPVADGDEIVGVLSIATIDESFEEAAENDRISSVHDHMLTAVAFCYVDDDPATARTVMEERGSPYLLVTDRQMRFHGVLAREAVAEAPGDGGNQAGRAWVAERRHVQTSTRATGERQGWLKTYSVKPRLRE